MPQGSRILIVEDEMIISMEIKQKLKGMGYDVVGQAISGESAIQKAGEKMPDLILMDIRLKGEMDGITAAKRIMELYDIPIIFLTAHSDKATLERAIAVSPSGYLLKPFKERELMTNIEMSLHKHRIKQKVREELHPEGLPEILKVLSIIQAPAIIISQKGIIEGINQNAAEVTGFISNELNGKPISTLFGQMEEISRDKQNGEKESGTNFILPDQVVLKHKDGRHLPVTLYAGFITPEDTSDIRHLIVFETDMGVTSESIRVGPEMIRYLMALTSALHLPAFVIDKSMVMAGHNSRFSDLARKVGISQYMLNRPLYETPRFSFFGDIQDLQENFKSGDREKQIKKVVIDEKTRFIEFTRIPLKKNEVTTHIAIVMSDVTYEQNAIYNSEKLKNLVQDFTKNLGNIELISHELRAPLQQILKRILEDQTSEGEKMKIIANQVIQLTNQFDAAWIKHAYLKDQILSIDSIVKENL